MKRGFETKREAQAWEREFLQIKSSNLDMTFGSFLNLYYEDRKTRIKKNTFFTKSHIIENKILPYFKDRKMSEIKATDIIAWQNTIMAERDANGEPHSPSYLKTIHNQISAIFNHACNFYNLPENPARKAGNMGKEQTKEMIIWTKEEYLKFADEMMDKPQAFYAFEILYWCGLRVGELLALTPADFDFEKSTLRVNKSYQRLEGEDIITDPKTPCSIRTITMPDFLKEEIKEYIGMLYGIGENDRIFDFTKSFLHHEMKRGSEAAGVKKLTLHQLRHQKQFHFLIDNDIETTEQLTAFKESTESKINELTLNRSRLYKFNTKHEIEKINKELRELRKDVRTCKNIFEDSERIQEHQNHIAQLEQQARNANKQRFKDKER